MHQRGLTLIDGLKKSWGKSLKWKSKLLNNSRVTSLNWQIQFILVKEVQRCKKKKKINKPRIIINLCCCMIFSVQLDRFWSANQRFFGSKQKKIGNTINTALEKPTNC